MQEDVRTNRMNPISPSIQTYPVSFASFAGELDEGSCYDHLCKYPAKGSSPPPSRIWEKGYLLTDRLSFFPSLSFIMPSLCSSFIYILPPLTRMRQVERSLSGMMSRQPHARDMLVELNGRRLTTPGSAKRIPGRNLGAFRGQQKEKWGQSGDRITRQRKGG